MRWKHQDAQLEKLKLRFIVDLLWICCTATRFVVQLFDVLWTRPAALFRFLVDLLSSSQQIHNILTCRGVVGWLWIWRKVEKLWSCCTTCCTTNPQQIEQMEFELNSTCSICCGFAAVDLLYSYSICCTVFRLVVDQTKALLHCFNLCGFVVESTTNTSLIIYRLYRKECIE
jgi:hypothetical protein